LTLFKRIVYNESMDLMSYIKNQNIRQTDLAKAINVRPQLVYYWINGVRPIPIHHCVAIERAIWAGRGDEFCGLAIDVARRFGVCYDIGNYSFGLSGLRKSQLSAAVSHIVGAVFFMSHRLAADFNEQEQRSKTDE